MGRLPIVKTAALMLMVSACQPTVAPPPPAGRFDAVAANPNAKPAVVTDFCDAYSSAEQAKTFSYPELAEAAPAQTGWRWVVLWATWCVPCVAEMPLLERWQQRLTASGKTVSMSFLSVDEDAEAVAAFRSKKNAGFGPRVKSSDALRKWLGSVGLDESTAIPVHILVDPNDKIRCVRTGSVDEHHYAAVAAVFAKP